MKTSIKTVSVQIIASVMTFASAPGFAVDCTLADKNRAQQLTRLAQKAEYRNDLNEAVRLSEKSVHACADYNNWHLLGRMRQDLGQFTPAQDAYSRAVLLAHNDEQKAFSIARYGEVSFMAEQRPEAVYALQTAIKLLTAPPQWMLELARQFRKSLEQRPVTRGFDPIKASGQSSDKHQQMFADKIRKIVEAIGGDVFEAFEILAQRGYEQYGEENHKKYDDYLLDILALHNSLKQSDVLFENTGLTETVKVLALQFQKKGESLDETVTRIKATNVTLEKMGLATTTIEGNLFNQALAEAAGGVAALNTMIDNYQQKIYKTISKGDSTIVQMRETVTDQFFALGLDINDFDTIEQFHHYFDNIKDPLAPEKMLDLLQAGKALDLLINQEQQLVELAFQEIEFIALMIDSIVGLINSEHNVDRELVSLREKIAAEMALISVIRQSDKSMETLDQLAQMYSTISDKLKSVQHDLETVQ